MKKTGRIAKGLYWDRAWSLVSGCTPISRACAGCWAAQEAHMRAANPNAAVRHRNAGLTVKEVDVPARFSGVVRTNADLLDLPLRTRRPTTWAVWTDLFHEKVPDAFVLSTFARMFMASHHTFLVLTKRPQRALAWLGHHNTAGMVQTTAFEVSRLPKPSRDEIGEWYLAHVMDWPLPNVWLGVTAENQAAAEERIPLLLQTPAAHRFVSIEPMLGPVDLKFFDGWDVRLPRPGAIRNYDGTAIEAVILGGETGPGARPMHPDWARGVRDQCRAATVPFFFKRWGEWGPTPEPYQVRIGGDDVLGLARVGRRRAGRVLDGRTHDELPWRAEVALK